MRLQRSWEFRDNGVGQNAGPILSSDQVSTYDREEAPFIKEIIFDPCYALEKKGKDTAHVQSTPLFITLRFVSLCKLKLIIPLLKRHAYIPFTKSRGKIFLRRCVTSLLPKWSIKKEIRKEGRKEGVWERDEAFGEGRKRRGGGSVGGAGWKRKSMETELKKEEAKGDGVNRCLIVICQSLNVMKIRPNLR